MADLGPFFAIDRHPSGAAPPAGWRSLTDLTGPGPALDARVRRVRQALAAGGGRSPDRIELRVAVSVAHLGLVARLIAPAVGAAALGSTLPLTAAGMWWRDELGGPYPLSVARPGSGPRPEPVPAAAGGHASDALRLPGSAVEAITDACLAAYSVSPRVLWGNAASAAVSAAGLVGAARPELAAAARDAADALLADRRVEGGALRAGPGFRRRSCCLIYRLAGSTAAVCGDCVLGAA
ncbi:(2Fe-2S)-binding protein [Nakamurella sp.]|uniref:(2Fe-2S)-binding protein n=1 Tax=Nakamurella sp. TaxID=1869182 RepID=UPI003784D6E4